MQNEKISVIIPVYNVEAYLERCIQSVLQQTYSNLEILCVNDGSTDKSGDILDHLASKDDRIIVIHHEQNQGLPAARNTALRRASGSYIGFVDSDDYISPDFYEKLIRPFQNDLVDIAVCGYYKEESDTVTTVSNKKKVPTVPMPFRDFFPYMYERDNYLSVASYVCTRLFRRKLIIADDQSLNVTFQPYISEDLLFMAEICTKCNLIQYIDEPLYYYFQRSNSIVHNKKKLLKSMDIPVVYEKMLDIYQNFGIEEDSLDFVRRLYARRCGQLLETAIELQDDTKIHILQEKIKSVFPAYVRTNMEHLERIQWLLDLLMSPSHTIPSS